MRQHEHIRVALVGIPADEVSYTGPAPTPPKRVLHHQGTVEANVAVSGTHTEGLGAVLLCAVWENFVGRDADENSRGGSMRFSHTAQQHRLALNQIFIYEETKEIIGEEFERGKNVPSVAILILEC